ncbi:MAG: PQQ-binding-like beta-propeller repeat protein [Phycisphaerae bacterium]|nr:PQQ-binding-like beta-propeller repeat protein [Phycisphaerae bacterium]
MQTLHRLAIIALGTIAAHVTPASADWPNLGGTPGRTGLSVPTAAESPVIRWSGGRASIIAWHPVIEGDRVILVRQTSFVPQGVPNDALVVCMSVTTGAELWMKAVPYNSGDWTTTVFGVKNGRVYAGRSGNGNSVSAKLYCLDVTDGATLWMSAQPIATGPYDGIAFADDGDPIVGTHTYVRRIESTSGATVWNTPRSCSVSGDCGPAVNGNFVYVDEVAAGGQIVTKIDVTTGSKLYATPVMPGFLTQTTPMVGPDGTVYYNRIQNNGIVDFFYCFDDNGASFTQRWKSASGYAPSGGYGLGADGSVYVIGPAKEIQRLDGATGAILAFSAPIATASAIIQPHFAIDGAGKIYCSNGAFAEGHLYCFEADLTPVWDVNYPAANQGGPTIAADGTLIIAGTGSDIRAYLAPPPQCVAADLDCDGTVGASDLAILLGAWGRCGRSCSADLDDDGSVGASDLALLLGAWG